jgi:hypothetical protein
MADQDGFSAMSGRGTKAMTMGWPRRAQEPHGAFAAKWTFPGFLDPSGVSRPQRHRQWPKPRHFRCHVTVGQLACWGGRPLQGLAEPRHRRGSAPCSPPGVYGGKDFFTTCCQFPRLSATLQEGAGRVAPGHQASAPSQATPVLLGCVGDGADGLYLPAGPSRGLRGASRSSLWSAGDLQPTSARSAVGVVRTAKRP